MTLIKMIWSYLNRGEQEKPANLPAPLANPQYLGLHMAETTLGQTPRIQTSASWSSRLMAK